MFKSLKKLTQKKENICARTGCNNQIKKERNGTEFNYCSSSCQMSHYSPGSNELYDEFDSPAYTSTSSNQWGVWSPNQDDAPPSYSSVSNNNKGTFDEDIFGSLDNVQVTPLWENDDPPPNTSNSRSRSRYSSSSKLDDDFPIWLGSTVDPLWTPSSNKNNNSSRNYSPPYTPPRSSSPNSDEEEINCPKCTFFIRPNKTVCEMCGTSITRQEPKKTYKRPPKPKTTISTYRDLYEEEDDDEVVDDDIEEILNPFADPTPRRNNQSSSDNYRNSSSSKSRNQSSRSSYLNYEDSSHSSHSQSRNQSSSRSRTSYQTPTPPSDELWIEEDDFFAEPVPSRRNTRHKPPPKPYTPPSFIRDAPRDAPRRNVQKPPTPPLKEDQITCSACNFDNHSSMTHCEICYTQLNKTPEPDKRTTRFNRIEDTRAKRACTACSFYNDVDSVQCEMCYSPIETVRRILNIVPHDPDKLQCPTCTFMNHKSMAQCEMCRNALPGNNLQQQVQEYQQFVDNLPGPVTKMFQLPIDDHDYMTTQQAFKAGIPTARILAIFRMIMPARIINAHEAHKKQIAGNNPVASVTHRMFHGTHVACDATRYYGAPGWKHCAAADCGLCGISQNGNSCARSKYNGRMWFANNSQTSLGYCRTDPIKAMFIQEIISAAGGPIIIVDKEAATLVKFLIIFQV